ncbi:histidine kinase [Actinomadura sp. LOL_016]|uniref:histidine kinase n=1 Tax=unclassified Actinomadura TaxID=2626254 RepID=UPI003A813A68
MPLAIGLHRLGSSEGVGGFTTFYLAACFAWGIGAWLRYTRAVEAHRTRIARELHDVVTHHVTATGRPGRDRPVPDRRPRPPRRALGAVTDTGRRAITDLRHLLVELPRMPLLWTAARSNDGEEHGTVPPPVMPPRGPSRSAPGQGGRPALERPRLGHGHPHRPRTRPDDSEETPIPSASTTATLQG